MPIVLAYQIVAITARATHVRTQEMIATEKGLDRVEQQLRQEVHAEVYAGYPEYRPASAQPAPTQRGMREQLRAHKNTRSCPGGEATPHDGRVVRQD